MCWQNGHLYLHTHTIEVSTKASKWLKYCRLWGSVVTSWGYQWVESREFWRRQVLQPVAPPLPAVVVPAAPGLWPWEEALQQRLQLLQMLVSNEKLCQHLMLPQRTLVKTFSKLLWIFGCIWRNLDNPKQVSSLTSLWKTPKLSMESHVETTQKVWPRSRCLKWSKSGILQPLQGQGTFRHRLDVGEQHT